MARSPRGGRHIYFASPELVEVLCSADRLGPGIDIRALGGYIVAPPSRTARGAYEWLRPLPPKDQLPGPRLAARETDRPQAAASGRRRVCC